MLARRRNAATDAAMQAWWEDVLRYSRRDQLSFVPGLRAHGIPVRSVAQDSTESDWHGWPRSNGRDEARRGTGLRRVLRPPAGRTGELEQALDATTHSMVVTVPQREQAI